MGLTIYGRKSSSNVQKLIWMCAELELPYDRIEIGGPAGGLDAPEYRALNPNGTIPTIIDDDYVLWESNAILRYLALKHGEAGLMPDEIGARCIVDQWLDWQMVKTGLGIRNLVFARKAGGGAREFADVQQQFSILDAHLAQSSYVAGDGFTIADIALGNSARRWMAMSGGAEGLVNLARWYGNIAARPAFAAIADLPSG